MPTRTRSRRPLVRIHNTLLTILLGMDRKPVRIDLLLGLAPQLDAGLGGALLAVVFVGAVAGVFLGVPDGPAFGHFEDGLQDGDAGCDDDEVAFDAVGRGG